jgi:heme oxygenase
MANKLAYHKTITDILREKRAYRLVIRNLHHSVQRELVREDLKRMGHEIRNLWSLATPLSLFFTDIELAANNNEIDHIEYLQNVIV